MTEKIITTGGAISRAINAAERAEEKVTDAPREFQSGALSSVSQAWSAVAEVIHWHVTENMDKSEAELINAQPKYDPDATTVMQKPDWRDLVTGDVVTPSVPLTTIWRAMVENAIRKSPTGQVAISFSDVMASESPMVRPGSEMVVQAEPQYGRFVIRLV